MKNYIRGCRGRILRPLRIYSKEALINANHDYRKKTVMGRQLSISDQFEILGVIEEQRAAELAANEKGLL